MGQRQPIWWVSPRRTTYTHRKREQQDWHPLDIQLAGCHRHGMGALLHAARQAACPGQQRGLQGLQCVLSWLAAPGGWLALSVGCPPAPAPTAGACCCCCCRRCRPCHRQSPLPVAPLHGCDDQHAQQQQLLAEHQQDGCSSSDADGGAQLSHHVHSGLHCGLSAPPCGPKMTGCNIM